ncbi:helix-turn-helix domain-containing protein [Mucilaginibacter litoreus]|uniref:Helix-turn-helix domain-containing protein n=2 Tax=Mucilaginibacter litoreus TaxID=1048221 RepID=A0ABW3AQY0_9SPHI
MLSSKIRPLFIAALLLMVISLSVCFKPDDNGFALAREIIVMRTIGHKILLSSGDSSSRVLPVYQTNDGQYHIRFESTFKFSPDSVVSIIRQNIEKNHLPADYIVNVVECQSNQVIFGFAILKTEQTNLVPCKGRKQPKAYYSVNIAFRDTMFNALNTKYVVATGGGLIAFMLIFSGLRITIKGKKSLISVENTLAATPKVVTIWRYKFHTDDQYLECKEEKVELSDKEAKLLNILATKQNELVERGVLQKVWEDEGVIVARSLDMFISKLRKKLESDPTVRVVNIHGKGYKL